MTYAERVRSSWEFLKSCLKFLGSNKDLLILPLFSLAAMAVIVVSLIAGSLFEFKWLLALYQKNVIFLIIGIAAIYFFLAFVIIFFNACLITCITQRLQGQPMGIFHAMFSTLKRTGSLLGWTLISASVCTLLKMLERAHDTVADIISAIFGFSWALTTYFVLPVMVVEQVGPIKAFKRSISLLGKGWRKLFSINLILFLIIAAIIGLVYGISYLLGDKSQQALFIQQHMDVFLPIGIFLVVAWIIINTTFDAIFNSALYLNINGQRLHNFDESKLGSLIERK